MAQHPWHSVTAVALLSVLYVHLASGQSESNVNGQCSCSACSGAGRQSANEGDVELAVSQYRSSANSESVYIARKPYRVTIQARVPIDSFSLCVEWRQGPQAQTQLGRADKIIRRYLPTSARLQSGCTNIVQQSNSFRRGTYGVVQIRWRAPQTDAGCFTFRLCAQKSASSGGGTITQTRDLCEAQYLWLDPQTQQSARETFEPSGYRLVRDRKRAASIELHALDAQERSQGTVSVFAPATTYLVRIRASAPFQSCYMFISTDKGYGDSDDSGMFTKIRVGGTENRWEGYKNVMHCDDSETKEMAEVFWQSPSQSTCVMIRVWHSFIAGEAVVSERRVCTTREIPICPEARATPLISFTLPTSARSANNAELQLERWNNDTLAWQRDEDQRAFRPNSVYNVVVRAPSSKNFTTCYASSVSIRGSVENSGSTELTGYFLNKAVDAPERCWLNYANIMTCHNEDQSARSMTQVTWKSPKAATSCVLLQFWLGSTETRQTLEATKFQLCRLVYVELPVPPTSLQRAPSTYSPVPALQTDYPGPQVIGNDITIEMFPWSEVEGAADSPTSYYNAGKEYLVQITSSKPFTRCYLMSHSHPTSESGNSGMFTRRHRSSQADHHNRHANVINCGNPAVAEENTKGGNVIWQAPGTSSVCIEIVVWLLVSGTTNKFTKVTKPYCQMKYPLHEGGCPSSLGSEYICGECSISSPAYVLHASKLEERLRIGCCAGLPHDTDNTMCCGNTIQPKLAGSSGLQYQCCGDDRYFNPTTGTCCRGNQQEGSALQYRCCRQRSFDPSALGGPPACCGDVAYTTNQQKCCAGELHQNWPNTIADDLRCCPGPDQPYNPDSHRCMWCRAGSKRVIQPKAIPLSCCGGLPYNSSQQVCCDQSEELLLPAISTQSACCNKQVYDQQKAKCCANIIVSGPPGVTLSSAWQCCGNATFNSQTHGCCNGDVFNQATQQCITCSGQRFVVDNAGAYQCCGGRAFSRLEEICCGATIRQLPQTHTTLASLPRYDCCGDVVYDTAKNACCSRRESALAPGPLIGGRKCCGLHHLYSEATERCVRCTGGTDTVVSRSNQVYCCHTQPYVYSEERCCPDGSVGKIDPTRPASSQPFYQCCSRSTVFDSRAERCCPDGRILTAGARC